MASLNKVFLLGRLGGDPEMRYTQDGSAVSNFSLATSTFSSKSGEKKEYTEWHKCVAFNKAAEVCGQYLKKGSQVLVEGSLRTNSWEDKEGNKRSMVEIVVGRLTMLGGKSSEEPKETSAREYAEASGGLDTLDSDVPF